MTAIRQRPPIFAALGLFGAMALLQPHHHRPAMGPAPACKVRGEWRGDVYEPTGHWNTPVAEPHGRFVMPNLGAPLQPKSSEPPETVLDVDVVVSGLKRLITPHKT